MSLSLKKIDELIEALFNNATSLIDESKLLHNHGYYTRAFSLAHFAREELSKIVMLQAAGMKVISGHEVDWKKLMRRFRNHKDKIRLETINNSLIFGSVGQYEEMENT